MANTALSRQSKADMRVKKFALDFVRPECEEGANRFARYRKREKAAYDFSIDGCNMHGDENSFAQNKEVLEKHYDNMIKAKIKSDDTSNSMRKAAIVVCLLALVFSALTAISLVVDWATGAFIAFLIIAILLWGIFALCVFLRIERAHKIRRSFEYRIRNGVKMLEDGLAQLGEWRTAYRQADSVHAELINVLKEVNS